MKAALLLLPYALIAAAFLGGCIYTYRCGYRDGQDDLAAELDAHLDGHAGDEDDVAWCVNHGLGDILDDLSLTAADKTFCRMCRCTNDRACAGGCWWVVDPAGIGDLCSACRPAALRDLAASGAVAQ